ncbi:GH1 family beta-glucosidase [Maribacter sp. 4G9]|uniref:GH1 family beta-glucosidase n=1 Tax=Maribacter sp. 4G9 TaxID=1889777 RepID=UPI000C14DD3F|nr:GH1 family beta-glucosidase [Maribacter sp. 4G9]PIB28871.1 beta-glucosidase [Maribacter sp. 4G9]
MAKKIHSSGFGKDFIWGVSTAAFQIEGAHDKHGKGPSIWDIFSSKKGNIRGNETAKTSCDFYHRYKEDIDLMKSLNIPNFRFSISWSRILPTGTGKINPEGIAFYNRVIDYCLELGITPWATLYHWDLPHALELKGGWTNREVLQWLEEYTKICAQSFGDRVKYWMVLNEPMVFTGGGYFLGVHAPGKKRLRNFLPAVHHAQLAQGRIGRLLRKIVPNSKVGTTFSCSYIVPKNNSQRNLRAAKRVDALLNRLFIEPVLGLGYPTKDLPILRRLKPYILPGDMEESAFQFDFIGIQNYTREVIQHNYFVPYIKAKIIEAPKRNVRTTLMDWEVYPPSIYEMIRKYDAYSNMPNIVITENGAAFHDTFTKGKIKDKNRKQYLKDHLEQVLKAKNEGLNVHGYFVWTLTDNFEWAEGYHPSFGLVHVDFKTQKRTVKKSGKWYRGFLKVT